MTRDEEERERARAQKEKVSARTAERERAERLAETVMDAEVPADLWEGLTDDSGIPLDEVYGDDIAPHVVAETPQDMSEQEAIAARYRLPEEFWGARELFKSIRQAAWASQTHPDAVLAGVLTRAAGAAGRDVVFDTGKSLGTMSLFACLLAPSGIGKSDAYKAASRLVRLPSHLCEPDGSVNMDVFRDGLALSTGEGIAESFMGTVEQEALNPDGSVKYAVKGRGRNAAPEPEMVKVRKAVRTRAFFWVDEGEALTKIMTERSGSRLGPDMRSAWSGGSLGQANASDDRWRHVPGGSYSMGLLIGYQPETAVAMLSDVGPGTPQRFLWFGAQDTEMPDPDEEDYEFPEPIVLPSEDLRTGIVQFPTELRRWLKRQIYGKHRGRIEIDPMDSHEPLMRAKLSALLCWLDGRWLVNRDDWTLAGMIWSASCAIRDRLIRHRDTQKARQEESQREARMAEATEIEFIRVTVSTDVERVARRIWRGAKKADEAFDQIKRYKMREGFGRDKKVFDLALRHAVSVGWVVCDESTDECVVPGGSQPVS